MEELGEHWATFLEQLHGKQFHEALSTVMVLSNQSKRLGHENNQQVRDEGAAAELAKFGRDKLRQAILDELKVVCKRLESVARETGKVASMDPATNLLAVAAGLDLVHGDTDDNTTSSTLQPSTLIAKLLIVNLTVECAVLLNTAKSHSELQKRTKNKLADNVFLDAITDMSDCISHYLALLHTTPALQLQGHEFLQTTCFSIASVAQDHLVPVLRLLFEHRNLKHILQRADQLGGLTLPRAMASTPPLTATTTTTTTLQPLSHDETIDLDSVVHDLSVAIRACEHVIRECDVPIVKIKTLRDVSMEYVDAMMKLDELWLTHNVTKAVLQSESLVLGESSGGSSSPPRINSMAEDVFHVVNISFSRAVHSTSRLAAEATANVCAGFVGDGFLEILKELVQKSKIPTATTTTKPGGGRRGGSDDAEQFSRAFDNLLVTSPRALIMDTYCEALNTVDASIVFTRELLVNVKAAFAQVFAIPQDHNELMAVHLLMECEGRLNEMLHHECGMFADRLYQQTRRQAETVMTDVLDPRAMYYEMGIAAYEASGGSGSWVHRYVKVAVGSSSSQAFSKLGDGVAQGVLKILVGLWATQIEEKLDLLKFTPLGALRFETDVRLGCELLARAFPLSRAHAGSTMEDASVMTTMIARIAFQRLRHWAFLLNLERRSHVESIPFPAPALTKEEIEKVLGKRVDKEFYE